MNHVSVRVRHHLEFDVVGVEDQFFEVAGAVAEDRLRLVAGGPVLVEELAFVDGGPHSLPTPAGGGLDHDGKAKLTRHREGFLFTAHHPV